MITPKVSPNLDLFGWDTAFAISLTKANEAIKAQKSSPATFELTETSKTGAKSNAIKGAWGDWSLTTKGDGQNVVIMCPITNGTFTSVLDPGINFDLSNTSIEMEIKLNFQQPPQRSQTDATAKPDTGVQHNLVVRTQTSDPSDPVASLKLLPIPSQAPLTLYSEIDL